MKDSVTLETSPTLFLFGAEHETTLSLIWNRSEFPCGAKRESNTRRVLCESAMC